MPGPKPKFSQDELSRATARDVLRNHVYSHRSQQRAVYRESATAILKAAVAHDPTRNAVLVTLVDPPQRGILAELGFLRDDPQRLLWQARAVARSWPIPATRTAERLREHRIAGTVHTPSGARDWDVERHRPVDPTGVNDTK